MFQNKASFLGQVPLIHPHPQALSGNPRTPRGRAMLSGSRRGLSGGAPVSLTDATFQQALSAPKAVIDFWSPTCPVCMSYKPVFEDVASSAPGDVLMAEANVDEANQSAQKYGFSSIPTTVFLANGQVVNQVSGGMTKQDLLAAIASAFGGGSPTPASATPTPTPISMPSPVAAPSAPVGAPSSVSLGAIAIGGISLVAVAGLGYFILKA